MISLNKCETSWLFLRGLYQVLGIEINKANNKFKNIHKSVVFKNLTEI